MGKIPSGQTAEAKKSLLDCKFKYTSDDRTKSFILERKIEPVTVSGQRLFVKTTDLALCTEASANLPALNLMTHRKTGYEDTVSDEITETERLTMDVISESGKVLQEVIYRPDGQRLFGEVRLISPEMKDTIDQLGVLIPISDLPVQIDYKATFEGFKILAENADFSKLPCLVPAAQLASA